jgi:hypothetical protein
MTPSYDVILEGLEGEQQRNRHRVAHGLRDLHARVDAAEEHRAAAVDVGGKDVQVNGSSEAAALELRVVSARNRRHWTARRITAATVPRTRGTVESVSARAHPLEGQPAAARAATTLPPETPTMCS